MVRVTCPSVSVAKARGRDPAIACGQEGLRQKPSLIMPAPRTVDRQHRDARTARGEGSRGEARVNTDDYPLIKYLATRTHRAVIAGTAQWLKGLERDRLYADLLDAMPSEHDPHIAQLSPAQQELPCAGAIYAEWRGLRSRDDLRAGAVWQNFIALTPPHARNPDSPAGQVATGGMAFGDAAN